MLKNSTFKLPPLELLQLDAMPLNPKAQSIAKQWLDETQINDYLQFVLGVLHNNDILPDILYIQQEEDRLYKLLFAIKEQDFLKPNMLTIYEDLFLEKKTNKQNRQPVCYASFMPYSTTINESALAADEFWLKYNFMACR